MPPAHREPNVQRHVEAISGLNVALHVGMAVLGTSNWAVSPQPKPRCPEAGTVVQTGNSILESVPWHQPQSHVCGWGRPHPSHPGRPHTPLSQADSAQQGKGLPRHRKGFQCLVAPKIWGRLLLNPVSRADFQRGLSPPSYSEYSLLLPSLN